MQSRSSCAWQAKNSIDADYARNILLCAYAELCRNAHRRACTLAIHSRPAAQTKPSPRQVIDALRHEIGGHCGTLQNLRKMIDYVLEHKRLPDTPLLPVSVVERLFEHFAGAQSLTRPEQRPTWSLGDALFDCLTRGCCLCDQPVDNESNDSTWSLVASQQPDSQQQQCDCQNCVEVRITKRDWQEICNSTDCLQTAVIEQCQSL